MVKTITVAAYNRPSNLALLLRTLGSQLTSLGDYRLCVSIDSEGKYFNEVKAVAEAANAQVRFPKKHWGLNKNTFESVRWAFEDARAEYNVYLEDDFALSPDAFNLVEWYLAHGEELRSHPQIRDIAVYCLCVLPSLRASLAKDTLDPEEVFLSRALQAWGFVLSRYQWETYVRAGWYQGNEARGTWDKLLANHIRTFPGVYNAIPALSRISNSGKTGRTSSRKYARQLQGHVYNQQRQLCDFHAVGIR